MFLIHSIASLLPMMSLMHSAIATSYIVITLFAIIFWDFKTNAMSGKPKNELNLISIYHDD